MGKKITLKESELISLIENSIIVKKNDLGSDWDAERIVKSKLHDKNMYKKIEGGRLEKIDRKSGTQKVYFLTDKDADIANKLIDGINELKYKLSKILK